MVVAKQRVQTQQANETEVSKHLVQSVTAKLSSYSHVLVWISCTIQQMQRLKKSTLTRVSYNSHVCFRAHMTFTNISTGCHSVNVGLKV